MIRPRPSLCTAGCSHYHHFIIQADAATPSGVLLPVHGLPASRFARVTPDGTVVTALPVFHEEHHHYCYPTPGIEIPLGSTPVLRCNRYECADPKQFRSHTALVQAWDRAYAELRAEADEFDRSVQETLTPKETP